MKKLLVIIFAALLCCSGCSSPKEKVGIIEGELPSYEIPVNAAYGTLPDISEIKIDGVLSESFWTEKNYTSARDDEYETEFFFTCGMSECGLYVGAYSNDPTVVIIGRNYYLQNTNVSFVLRTPKGTRTIRADANNVKPGQIAINGRTSYDGKLNDVGGGKGMSVEMFIEWDELGFSEKPDTVEICPYYCYKVRVYCDMFYLYPSGKNGKYLTFNDSGLV